ncbi:MAG: hypothetical protein M3235_07350, partial [Actinomycetota bacterium]|nr:hypothetical protein [Actinomycetota bacterium]
GGAVREVRLPPEPDPPTAAGRRALAELGLSATPGSVVLDVRSDEDGAERVVLHRVAGRPAPDERVLP